MTGAASRPKQQGPAATGSQRRPRLRSTQMLFSTQKLFFFPVEDEIARVLDSGLPASVNDAGPEYTGPVAYWRGERYGVVACLVARDGRYELTETICELRPDGLWENRGGGGCGLLHHP